MTFRRDKLDRIEQVIAICVKNDITPEKNSFAGFVIRVCSTRFGLDVSTARSYIGTILASWRGDHWKFNVKDNAYLTKEEREKWIQSH